MKTNATSSFIIHEFPRSVRLALKQLAISADKTLRQYVIDLLSKHTETK